MFPKTFKGGVHPDDKKLNTKDIAIKELPVPERIILPISQHIGAPNVLIVDKGDRVKMGQCIAQTNSFVSAPVHSPVSGEIAEITKVINSSGAKVDAVVIKNDGLDEVSPEVKGCGSLDTITPEEIKSAVRKAGIVGMGGASFPTHVKLSPSPDKKVDCCIINGAECEPYLTSDYRVMIETPEKITFGLKVIMKALGISKGYIAIEENKKDAYDIISDLLKPEDGIETVLLRTKYPQGSEKHLIKAVTGRKVPSGGLPMDVGVVVNNIDTCTAVGNAIKTGMPLISRIVTVSGNAFASGGNYRVRIGTPISCLINEVGGFSEEPEMLIMGGPMMGAAVYSDEVPIMKNNGALLALTKEEVSLLKPGPCLRCGKCVSACPMNLQPLYLATAAEKNDYDRLKKFNVLDCIECGSCSFTCPAKRLLAQNIRIGKQKVIAEMKRGSK